MVERHHPSCVTHRSAVAHRFVKMYSRGCRGSAQPGKSQGGSLEVARMRGFPQPTDSEWIPLCHPLPLTHIDVHPTVCKNGVEIFARTVTAAAQTGVR